MHSILNTAIPYNLQRQDAILVRAQDHADDGRLVDARLHGDVVRAWFQDEVGQERVANCFSSDGEVHGYVAQVESHDRWVGDMDCAEHIGAVG